MATAQTEPGEMPENVHQAQVVETIPAITTTSTIVAIEKMVIFSKEEEDDLAATHMEKEATASSSKSELATMSQTIVHKEGNRTGKLIRHEIQIDDQNEKATAILHHDGQSSITGTTKSQEPGEHLLSEEIDEDDEETLHDSQCPDDDDDDDDDGVAISSSSSSSSSNASSSQLGSESGFQSDDEATSYTEEKVPEVDHSVVEPQLHLTDGTLFLLAQRLWDKGIIQLQALVRCYCVRRNYQRTLQSIRSIQTWIRPKIQSGLTIRTAVHIPASIRIQTVVRGFMTRRAYCKLKHFVQQNVAALTIQRWWHMVYIYPTTRSKQTQAASTIQSRYRAWQTSEFYNLQRFAVTLIQSHIRGRQTRQNDSIMTRRPTTTLVDTTLVQHYEARAVRTAATDAGDNEAHQSLSTQLQANREYEISMPDLESMGIPSESICASESNCASSERSDGSMFSGLDSGEDAIITSNVIVVRKVKKKSMIQKEEEEESITDSFQKPLLAGLPHGIISPESPVSDNASSIVLKGVPSTIPAPPTDTPRARPILPIKTSSDCKTINDRKVPPCPMRTDDNNNFDEEFERRISQDMNKVSLFFSVLLILCCFVGPVLLFAEERSSKQPGTIIDSHESQPLAVSLSGIIAQSSPTTSHSHLFSSPLMPTVVIVPMNRHPKRQMTRSKCHSMDSTQNRRNILSQQTSRGNLEERDTDILRNNEIGTLEVTASKFSFSRLLSWSASLRRRVFRAFSFSSHEADIDVSWFTTDWESYVAVTMLHHCRPT
jgi:hypothetical protein